MGAPEWVKKAGLEDAHNKAEAAQPVVKAETVVANTAKQANTPATDATVTPAATPTPTPAAAPFDQNAFARTLAEHLRPAPVATPAPQQTDAELRAQLNIFEVDATGYEEVFGVAPRDEKVLAAYNKHLQGVARQAVTMSNILNQRALQQHQESLTPYVQAVRGQEANRQRELFKTENPDLIGYDGLAQKEFQLALASGKKFPTVDAARKYVADQVRGTLKGMGITPTVPSTSNTTTTTTAPKPSARTMTPTQVGGRSGASATGKPASTSEQVWGKRK